MLNRDLLASRNGRFASFSIMYISEGIPYGFTSIALVSYLRTQGIGLDEIGGMVAALFFPWAMKWAWAPVVDIFRFNRYGGRKAWISFCTAMMLVTLAAVLLLDVGANFQTLLIFIVINNFFAATQDVAIDSLAVSALRPDERARGNGFMFGGQYGGIALGGAGSIALFGMIGFEATVVVMCALLAANLAFILTFVQDPDIKRTANKHGLKETLHTFYLELRIGFLKSGRGPKVGFLFSLLPCGAIALAYATMSTIQVDYGLQEATIAKITASNTITAGAGCIIGGLLGDRFGVRRVIFIAYLGTAIPTLALAFSIYASGLQAVPLELLWGAIASHGFIFGIAFGLRAAMFMGISNPAVGATMFTAFMAMSNVAISYTNFWQGQVAESIDYATVLFLDSAIILISLLLIPLFKDREEAEVPAPVRID